MKCDKLNKKCNCPSCFKVGGTPNSIRLNIKRPILIKEEI